MQRAAEVSLERFGTTADGDYLLCGNLSRQIESAYSYGVGLDDSFGCDVSKRYGVPVHQYDCFDPARPVCADGTFDFHDECIGPQKVTQEGRIFDTLESQIARNGDVVGRCARRGVDDEHDASDVRHGDLHRAGCSRRAHSIRPANHVVVENGDHRLPHFERGPDGFDQRGVAEWLEQTRHRAGREEARLERLIALRGDEHNRDSFPAASQFLLKIWSAHPW